MRSEVRFWHHDAATGQWSLKQTLRGESGAALSASGVNGYRTDDLWVSESSYVMPTTYSLAHADSPSKQERLKALPKFFDATGLQVPR